MSLGDEWWSLTQVVTFAIKVWLQKSELFNSSSLTPPYKCWSFFLNRKCCLPLLDYGDIVWGDKNNAILMVHLQVLQNNAARLVLDLPRANSSASQAINQLNWKPLFLRRRYHRCVAIFKCLNNLVDFDFNLKKNKDIHDHYTRRRENLHLPFARTNWGKQRFVFNSLLDWNSLDSDLKLTSNFQILNQNWRVGFRNLHIVWFLF